MLGQVDSFCALFIRLEKNLSQSICEHCAFNLHSASGNSSDTKGLDRIIDFIGCHLLIVVIGSRKVRHVGYQNHEVQKRE